MFFPFFFKKYKQARSLTFVLLAIGNFTMGPNEQNQHFEELRQKVFLYILDLVLLRCLPSLDVIHKLFVTKMRKNGQPSWGQTDYSSSFIAYH